MGANCSKPNNQLKNTNAISELPEPTQSNKPTDANQPSKSQSNDVQQSKNLQPSTNVQTKSQNEAATIATSSNVAPNSDVNNGNNQDQKQSSMPATSEVQSIPAPSTAGSTPTSTAQVQLNNSPQIVQSNNIAQIASQLEESNQTGVHQDIEDSIPNKSIPDEVAERVANLDSPVSDSTEVFTSNNTVVLDNCIATVDTPEIVLIEGHSDALVNVINTASEKNELASNLQFEKPIEMPIEISSDVTEVVADTKEISDQLEVSSRVQVEEVNERTVVSNEVADVADTKEIDVIVVSSEVVLTEDDIDAKEGDVTVVTTEVVSDEQAVDTSVTNEVVEVAVGEVQVVSSDHIQPQETTIEVETIDNTSNDISLVVSKPPSIHVESASDDVHVPRPSSHRFENLDGDDEDEVDEHEARDRISETSPTLSFRRASLTKTISHLLMMTPQGESEDSFANVFSKGNKLHDVFFNAMPSSIPSFDNHFRPPSPSMDNQLIRYNLSVNSMEETDLERYLCRFFAQQDHLMVLLSRLKEITRNEESFDELQADGISEMLLSLIKTRGQHDVVLIPVCGIIKNLCYRRSFQSEFGSLGLCTLLHTKLREKLSSALVVAELCDCLHGLAYDVDNREIMSGERIAPLILQVINTYPDNLAVLNSAYGCVKALSLSASFRDDFSALCTSLCEKCHEQALQPNILITLIGAIKCLCINHDRNRRQFGDSHMCLFLSGILTTYQDSENLMIQSCGAIANLAALQDNAIRFGQCGVCPSLLSVMTTHLDHSRVVTQACGAIINLSNTPSNAPYFGIWSQYNHQFVDIMHHYRSDLHLVIETLWVINNLTVSIEDKTTLGAATLVTFLVEILNENQDNPSLILPTCGALHNLSVHNENSNILATLQIIPTLCNYLTAYAHSNEDVLIQVCGIIANLSNNATCRLLLTSHDICTRLVTILHDHMANPQLIIQVCGAINNLSVRAELASQFGTVGICTVLVDLLRSPEYCSSRSVALIVLYAVQNLIYNKQNLASFKSSNLNDILRTLSTRFNQNEDILSKINAIKKKLEK